MLMYFIFSKYDASLKTNTCKVPESIEMTYINNAYVLQAIPIEYPSGNTKAGNYRFTVIGPFGFYSGDDIYNVTGSSIWMTSTGSIYGQNTTYKDSDNPIICKYWYFDFIY